MRERERPLFIHIRVALSDALGTAINGVLMKIKMKKLMKTI